MCRSTARCRKTPSTTSVWMDSSRCSGSTTERMRSIASGRGRSLSTATSSPMSFQNAPTGNPSRRRRITFSLWGMSAMSWDSKRCATGTR